MDEHGIKVQQSAAAADVQPIDWCAERATQFRRLFHLAGIFPTDFVRTSEPRHERAVHAFWRQLESGGTIESGLYEGWYCSSTESFLGKNDVRPTAADNKRYVSVDGETPVEWCSERNYTFALGRLKAELSRWLTLERPVVPEVFNDIALHSLESIDAHYRLSVSRSVERLQWGIPVPDDDSQIVYVWLDALVNYLTTCGYPDSSFSDLWPADAQVFGKDILRFHAIYWPAFLLAAGLPLPKRLFCHSHWTVEHRKMSKSIGNVVDPFERMKIYTPEGLRFFLLRTGVPHSDSRKLRLYRLCLLNFLPCSVVIITGKLHSMASEGGRGVWGAPRKEFRLNEIFTREYR